MNEDHVLELPKPGPVDLEIVDLAWPVNVADFLAVIAGHMRAGEAQDLAFAALVCQPQGGEP